MQRDINSIAREYCRRSRLVRDALVSASARSAWGRTELLREDPRERFARAVIDRLDGIVLRYSMRLELLELAARLGIARFDACLIIAQVQHRAGLAPPARRSARWLAVACSDGIIADTRPASVAHRSWQIAPFVVAGLIQLGIFAGVWAMAS